MCEKRFHNRLDRCLKPLLLWLKDHEWDTVASCCGHDKYPITIIVRYTSNGKDQFVELFSGTTLPRTRKFYMKDSKGYYYIPEVAKRR